MLIADAAHLPLRDGCVQCVVTSPPYWGLRDYGVPPLVWGGEEACEHEWTSEAFGHNPGRSDHGTGDPTSRLGPGQDGIPGGTNQGRGPTSVGAFCVHCSAWRGALGLEPTPELYVEHLVQVFREVRRVLRDDGTLWLNLGDSYATNSGKGDNVPQTKWPANAYPTGAPHRLRPGNPEKNGGQSNRDGAPCPPGMKPKNLVGIPWRVAFALQADGWYLRSDVIWSKLNPMPESVTDRPTKSHEYLFLLTKAERYYYDAEAIKERSIDAPGISRGGSLSRLGRDEQLISALAHRGDSEYASNGSRNRRSVWTIATEPYPAVHFATMPPKLVQPCILAGTSARGGCAQCGAPWERDLEREKHPERDMEAQRVAAALRTGRTDGHIPGPNGMVDTVRSRGWQPTCDCGTTETRAQLVCDPFAGSGTVGLVAHDLGRRFVGVELNPAYVGLAQRRIAPRQAVMEW